MVEIWIVEDDPGVGRALQKTLSRKHEECRVVLLLGRSGSAAYKAFKAAKVPTAAMVVTDGLDGCHRMVLEDHHGPSAVFTGDPRGITAPPGVPVFEKPGHSEQLYRFIEDWVVEREEDKAAEDAAIRDVIRHLRVVDPTISGTDGYHIDVLRGLL